MTVNTRECVFDLVNITDTSAYSFLVISVFWKLYLNSLNPINQKTLKDLIKCYSKHAIKKF